jgi:hypothetical protein
MKRWAKLVLFPLVLVGVGSPGLKAQDSEKPKDRQENKEQRLLGYTARVTNKALKRLGLGGIKVGAKISQVDFFAISHLEEDPDVYISPELLKNYPKRAIASLSYHEAGHVVVGRQPQSAWLSPQAQEALCDSIMLEYAPPRQLQAAAKVFEDIIKGERGRIESDLIDLRGEMEKVVKGVLAANLPPEQSFVILNDAGQPVMIPERYIAMRDSLPDSLLWVRDNAPRFDYQMLKGYRRVFGEESSVADQGFTIEEYIKKAREAWTQSRIYTSEPDDPYPPLAERLKKITDAIEAKKHPAKPASKSDRGR